jgi:hypothetical protein
MKVRGTCVYAERRQARSGGRFWRVGLKGEDGQTRFFNTSAFAGKVGEVVTIEVSEAEWKKAMAGGEEMEAELEKEAKRSGRDLLILKQVALKAAVEYAASRASQEWKADDILRLAQRFTEWLVEYVPPIEPEYEEPADEEVIQL